MLHLKYLTTMKETFKAKAIKSLLKLINSWEIKLLKMLQKEHNKRLRRAEPKEITMQRMEH